MQERPALHRKFIVTGILLALSVIAVADENQAQLARVRERLQTLQADVNATQGERDSVREEIDGLDRKIDPLVSELRATEKLLKTEEQQLRSLRAQAAKQQRRFGDQREELARQLRAQYAAGRQQQLKLLLNQQDPMVAARVLAYYRYIHRARLERIESIRTALA